MAISNGYDETKVLAALHGRIGWKQPFDPQYAIVDNPNQQTKSGRFYNDFHPTVTIPNIKDLQEYSSISNVDFNKLLSSLTDTNILSVIAAVFYKPQLIDSPEYMYCRADRTLPITVQIANNFVGYRVHVVDRGYTAQLQAIKLLFDETFSLPIYVFKENVPEPIFNVSIPVEANAITEAFLPDFLLSGGNYYIGYFQDDLGTAKPIEYSSNFGCYSIIGFESISVPVSALHTLLTDNYRQTGYTTHGINFEVSTYRDYTNEIIRSANLFDELQGLSMCIQVIQLIYYSNRSNDTQRETQDKDAKAEVEQVTTETFPMSPGIKSRYKRELEKVRRMFFKEPEIMTTLPTDYDLSESSTNWDRHTYPKGATDFVRHPNNNLDY